MALTRAMLKGMGLTEEQVGAIIEEHTSVTGALKEQIKEAKADSEKLTAVQKELEETRKSNDSEWQKKYEKEHADFEAYKKDTAAKEKAANIRAAYRKLLEDAKVDSKRIDTVMRATVFNDMDLDGDGKLVNADKLTEGIKTEWADFITTESIRGAGVETPPGGKPGGTANGRAKEIAEKFAAAHGYVTPEKKE